MELQWFLKSQGFFPKEQECTMYFGTVTDSSLKKWQETVGVTATGGFGPMSRAAFLDTLEKVGSSSKVKSQAVATSATVHAAAPPQAHARPLSSPLVVGLSALSVVLLLVKGYSLLVSSAKRRDTASENASVLEQDRAEQKRRYNSALKTDRPAADSKDIKDK